MPLWRRYAVCFIVRFHLFAVLAWSLALCTLSLMSDPHVLCPVFARAPQIKQLQGECSDLDRQVITLKAKCEEIEMKERQRRAADEERHAEEVRRRVSVVLLPS